MHIRNLFLSSLFTLVSFDPALALDAINSTGANHLAIRGTDPTAYFRISTPAEGSGKHVVKWRGATWHFVSQTEAALFEANPEAYAPQFGAYCTGGLSQQHVVEGGVPSGPHGPDGVHRDQGPRPASVRGDGHVPRRGRRARREPGERPNGVAYRGDGRAGVV